MQLIDERGPIRLAIELAIGLGSLAAVAAWTREAVARRRGRGAEVAAVARPEERRAA